VVSGEEMKSSRLCDAPIVLLALLSVLAGAALLPSASHPAQGQGTNFNLEGKITDLSPGKLTVNMEGNIIMHVTYSAKTEIHREGGSAGSSKDLKVGAIVKVQGDLNSSGVVEARRIDLE
jgi:hypothetical protein